MNSVVVTGALGRIGQEAVTHLSMAGYNVIAISRPGPDYGLHPRYKDNNVRVHLKDCLGDPESCRLLFAKADAVVHLACSSNPSISEAQPWDDINQNLVGTLKLFQIAQSEGVQQFLFPSSGGTVYGKTTQLPTPETALPSPISLHGSLKLATEHYLTALARRSTTHLKILRIANPYGMASGSKQQGFIDVALAKLRASRPIVVWGDGNVRRDYLHIDDLTAAVIASLQREASFTVNIGSATAHSLHEILTELGRHFELEGRVFFEPARSMDVPVSVLDIQLARELLAWSPRITLADGIKRAVDEY